LYHPIWQKYFRDHFDIKDGKIAIDANDLATKKFLAMQINDNVLINIDKFRPLLFDTENRFHKGKITSEQRTKIVDKLLSEKNYTEVLDRAIDKILLAHRNTRLFLIMMTGPFLILLTIVKYSIKAIVLYYFYKKTKSQLVQTDSANH
jgi:hypothetical protein